MGFTEFVGALTAWFFAVLTEWQVFVTGGIISAILAVIQARRQKSFSWKFHKGLFATFFMLAFFMAWKAERDEKVQLTNNIASLKEQNGKLQDAINDKEVDTEEERRRRILHSLRMELIMRDSPPTSPALQAGSEPLPKEWTEKRLRELGETWIQDKYLYIDRAKVRADLARSPRH